MKKIILSLAMALSGYCSYSQTFNATSHINAAGSANSFLGGYTFAYATSGTPWNGAFMSFGGFPSNNYDCQLSTDYGPNGGTHISFRTLNGDAVTWNPWYEIWNTSNLNNASSDFNAKNIHAYGGISTQTSNALNNYLTVSNNTISTSFGAAGTSWGLVGTTSNHDFAIYTNNAEQIRITTNGNVGVGTTDTKGYKLAVNGNAIATSMTVKLYANWPDYVFKEDYKLPSLSEIKSYIDKNSHLPDMPSQQEVKDKGINLGEMVKVQTKKIEELTLYLIDKETQVRQLQAKVDQQQVDSKQQETRIAALEAALAKLIPDK